MFAGRQMTDDGRQMTEKQKPQGGTS